MFSSQAKRREGELYKYNLLARLVIAVHVLGRTDQDLTKGPVTQVPWDKFPSKGSEKHTKTM